MENEMETTIMENQMEKKMENQMETTIMENQMEKKMENKMETTYNGESNGKENGK